MAETCLPAGNRDSLCLNFPAKNNISYSRQQLFNYRLRFPCDGCSFSSSIRFFKYSFNLNVELEYYHEMTKNSNLAKGTDVK